MTLEPTEPTETEGDGITSGSVRAQNPRATIAGPLRAARHRMNFESLGPPALQIGALRIWVHGRQLPEAVDEWDGNWLNVSAHYAAHGAGVAVSGSILDTVSFATFE